MGLGGERSGRHCVYDHAEVFDGPGRGEVGLFRVYYYAEGAAECEELVACCLVLVSEVDKISQSSRYRNRRTPRA